MFYGTKIVSKNLLLLHKWGHANLGALNGILLLQDTYDFDVQSAVAKGQIISEAITVEHGPKITKS